MKTQFIRWLLFVAAIGVAGALAAAGKAAERKSTQYEVVVEAQKSDLVRMIEAYERLSGQYLALVQEHLMQMSTTHRHILEKLDMLEKKLDRLEATLVTAHTFKGSGGQASPLSEKNNPTSDKTP